ncbi:threonine ammonia-lyase IlvA [Capnocytophaga sp.]|uniref:threonine ammonia-lyase IlvA n=1 Tax=Capnocytophaga sp. TaxID=44737 RepID=UPI0026DB09EB|nr:threonine ammonia-lyase IlvA [Capnocytophaga sp.]MDO5104756.1 threonine ammonia-lyase IlvA [Capnocytophaga sp.]
MYIPQIEDVQKAVLRLKNIVVHTPLSPSIRLGRQFEASIFLKREDLQPVRSYKIRGAYNKISALTDEQKQKGIVCASAGNHAQGVALSCRELNIQGTIYMPVTTPQQKIEQVQMFGEDMISIVLEGDTFDDSNYAAIAFSQENDKVFIPPFDDEKVIEGQATIALEILEQSAVELDYVFVPIGGGGLSAGVSSILKVLSPKTKIIGVEPLGAMSMKKALEVGEPTELSAVDTFVDGASVKKVGRLNFDICRHYLDEVIGVHEGKVCQTILELYNRDAIVVEPAGALTISALESYKKEIKGKNVVCIVSGSNNDITRTAEIKERALLYANLKHYFVVRFPQRAGALKEFVTEVLGKTDDITHFEYMKKNNRENGSAVVGIELKHETDLQPLIDRMKLRNFYGDYLNDKPDLLQVLV